MITRILSFPSRHPYTAKFHNNNGIVFVNPDTDYFNKIGGSATPQFIKKKHQLDSYDIVHIHFSFDKLSTRELSTLLSYFKKIGKPIVWTCHSRESQRERNIGNGELQKLLYSFSSAIISPTHGCKLWLEEKFGKIKSIDVIPLGYMTAPSMVNTCVSSLKMKCKNNFIYFVGEMRQNKEINFSIKAFLNTPQLADSILTVITKPLSEDIITTDNRKRDFWNVIHSSPRIKVIAKSEISNELLTQRFCEQHVCMLPYLWGTHSGQIELARDCGCHAVVSNVGFYKDQDPNVVEFKYDENISIFTERFIKSLIKARGSELLVPPMKVRDGEMKLIIKKHKEIYRNLLKN